MVSGRILGIVNGAQYQLETNRSSFKTNIHLKKAQIPTKN